MIGDKLLKTKSQKLKAGFTLVEMLVAMGIFSLVITLVVTIYVTVIGSQRRAFGLQDVLDSSRFALESMARAIRQSTVTSFTQTTLNLSHPNKGTVSYSLAGNRLYEGSQSLTSQGVIVDNLQFIVSGFGNNDGLQPRVTIVLRLISNTPKASDQASVNVQTTITPRNLELP